MIALVTGSNKGIGFEAVRQLAENNFKVILTSRDASKGEKAVETLKKEGLDVVYHQLDVSNSKSVKQCLKFVETEFGRLDVLVNNAGVLLDRDSDETNEEIFKKTFEVNVHGPLRMMQAFVPLMIKNNFGRIINVSSGMGQLSDMGSGWPTYRVSKTALNALTRIFASETTGQNVKVNSICPGWVRTDMGGANATRGPEEAADTIVWLARAADSDPTGGFFRDRKPIPW